MAKHTSHLQTVSEVAALSREVAAEIPDDLSELRQLVEILEVSDEVTARRQAWMGTNIPGLPKGYVDVVSRFLLGGRELAYFSFARLTEIDRYGPSESAPFQVGMYHADKVVVSPEPDQSVWLVDHATRRLQLVANCFSCLLVCAAVPRSIQRAGLGLSDAKDVLEELLDDERSLLPLWHAIARDSF